MKSREKKECPRRVVIGLDLGGTKLAAARFVVARDGVLTVERALANRKYDEIFGAREKRNLTPQGRAALIVRAMAEAIEELSDGLERGPEVVGVCSAGFVEDGVIAEAWNVGMKNFPLRERLASEVGMKVCLYKDSWAPAYGLRLDQPAIIFSVGTGFGGVSREADASIKIKSFTACRKIKWIPRLYCNDDPGYAVSFSTDKTAAILARGAARAVESCTERNFPAFSGATAREWSEKLWDRAKFEKRVTPTKLELFFARALAPEAARLIRPGEIFADFIGSALTPTIFYTWLTGRGLKPWELDELLETGDANAIMVSFMHAEFIGYILFEMQSERVLLGFPEAREFYGTGSGFNKITSRVTAAPILRAASDYCTENGIGAPQARAVRLIDTEEALTTFACFGAASGAAAGIE